MNPPAKALLQSLAAVVLAASTLVGCKTVHSVNSRYDTTVGKKHAVTNVKEVVDTFPAHLRRVALLPLYKGRYDHIEMALLEENVAQELGGTNLFELVVVEPERMTELFGAERFSSVETLPTQLLSKLHEVYAIDGVMLVDLTYFNAYQPVSIGMRAKLLDGHTGEIVWAADEIFDASNPAVSNAARKYFQNQSTTQYPLHQTQSALNSPTRFSKYVAHALFDTIQRD